ncbi:dethiobiotin synthase [soil metagenome]
MSASVFVTGTGTEVGKTVVAAVIARTLASEGHTVHVFKPAVSGLDDYAGSDELPDHELLRLASGSDQGDDEIAPYRYGPPLSPHLAAELVGEAIEPALLLEAAGRASAGADAFVCEGVGGFLVPLTPQYLIRDLARELALPVFVVASPGLGTINHTLLTIGAVRAAGLEVSSVVLTPWHERPEPLHRSNAESIERLGKVEVKTLNSLDLAHPDSWPGLTV